LRYRLKVYSGREGLAWMRAEAAAPADAVQHARSLGYSVLLVEREDGLLSRLRPPTERFPLVVLTRQLLALLRAGLNLVESFEALAEKETSPHTRRVLDGVLAGLRAGQSLSVTLESHPEAFPALYVATVRASERTSNIQEALARYVSYQVQLDQLQKRVVSALIYPALLLAAGAMVSVFLLLYVVPRFSAIYADGGEALPLLTRLLIEWGGLVNAYTGETLLAATALLVLLGAALARPGGRALLAAPVLRLPPVAARLKLFRLARLYRTIGMLLQGGIPIVPALAMVRELLPPGLQPALEAAAARIRDGGLISEAMLAHGLTTPVALRMLRVGEQAGNMGEMMDNVAAFYDDDVARAAEVFTRTFEPVLMAVIGVIIGGIVILMYLPIFELASGIQ